MQQLTTLRWTSIAVLFIWLVALAQGRTVANQQTEERAPGWQVPLFAHKAQKLSRVPARSAAGRPGVQSTVISVNYIGGWTGEAQAAFQRAVDIWAAQISSNVTIVIEANWSDLGGNTLGQAGPAVIYRDFSGAPIASTWYPVALANKLANQDLAPNDPDIEATFNSNYSNWYFGLDGNTPIDYYDFTSVVLHEIGHGLGFTGSMTVSGGQGRWGWQDRFGNLFPAVYDHFAFNGMGQALLDPNTFPSPSIALGGQLQGNSVYFNGANANAAAGGSAPRLYAPASWQQGSSYSHLNESSYPAGNPNSLMTPSIGDGESIHDPGGITRGIFMDMGWAFDVAPPTATATNTMLPTATPTQTSTPTITPSPTATPIPPTPTPVLSTFDTGADGWLMISGQSPFMTAAPTYVPFVGNQGGFITGDGAGLGGIWYWRAPAKFLGNVSAVYQQTLSFDLRQTDTTNQFDTYDVILESAGKSLVFEARFDPRSFPTRYVIVLHESAGWKDMLTGTVPSQADMKAVLGSLTGLRIRGEYSSNSSTTTLDNVKLGGVPSVPLETTVRTDGGALSLEGTTLTTATFPGQPLADAFRLTFELTGTVGITRGLGLVGDAFVLEARKLSDGSMVTDFTEPFTITIEYTSLQVRGFDEAKLTLYYWNPSARAWQTAGIQTSVDLNANRITATLDHLSQFALLGPTERINMPLIMK